MIKNVPKYKGSSSDQDLIKDGLRGDFSALLYVLLRDNIKMTTDHEAAGETSQFLKFDQYFRDK